MSSSNMIKVKRNIRIGEKSVGGETLDPSKMTIQDVIHIATTEGVDGIDFTKLPHHVVEGIGNEGYLCDKMTKESGARVKILKLIALKCAKDLSAHKLRGGNGTANITKTTSSFIDPRDLLKLLIKLEKKNLFMDMVKVSLSDVRKYIAEDDLSSIMEVNVEEYGSVSFKPTK